MAWDRGKRLDGDRYEIEAVLGCGRFAVTYKAWDTKQQRQPVAIKTLNEETRLVLAAQDPEKCRRVRQTFLDEARGLMKCDHPHVVKVLDLFMEGDGPCVVMEFVAGEDLTQCGRGVTEAQALGFVGQIGAALDHIHGKGILHRDVRPGNIRLRAGEATAVLIDFGSALAFSDELSCTQSASHAGGFAAPEAYTSQGKRGAWTDLYSLGAVLYWLVTGDKPATALERKLAIRDGKADPLSFPSNLDRSLVGLIEQVMRLEGGDRPKSAVLWLGQMPKGVGVSPKAVVSWKKIWTGIAAMAVVLGAIGGAMQGWAALFGPLSEKQPSAQQEKGR